MQQKNLRRLRTNQKTCLQIMKLFYATCICGCVLALKWNISHCCTRCCRYQALPSILAVNLWINSITFHHFILCLLGCFFFSLIKYEYITCEYTIKDFLQCPKNSTVSQSSNAQLLYVSIYTNTCTHRPITRSYAIKSIPSSITVFTAIFSWAVKF